MTRIYPFKWYERIAAVALCCLALAGFLPQPAITREATSSGWQVCVVIGFIPSWRSCWEFPRKPKPPMEPTYSCSDTDTGPCQ